jgi:hypothetical protein
MLRKMIVALSVTAATTLGAAETASKAEAAEPRINVSFGGPGWSVGFNNGHNGPSYYPSYPAYCPPVYQPYEVLYRTCPREPWRVYGDYRSHHAAHEVAERLEWRGYEARVAHH